MSERRIIMDMKLVYFILGKLNETSAKETDKRQLLREEKGNWKTDSESNIEFCKSIGRQDALFDLHSLIQDCFEEYEKKQKEDEEWKAE